MYFNAKFIKIQFKWRAEKDGFNFNLLDDGFGDVPYTYVERHGLCRRGGYR